jgi:lipopolysaccharide/colanic/teichoic acid biosynthesis glycosyltransferase
MPTPMSADLYNMDATKAWPDVDTVPASVPLYLPNEPRFYQSVKPAIDLITSVFLLPLLLPFIALAWVLIKLSSRGPGFYVQTRSGFEAAPYQIIKIRSMKSDLATAKNMNWASKNDSRITVVGKILRALHLDELPQVFNVIRGEMSLVGPRPERPEVIASKGSNKCLGTSTGWTCAPVSPVWHRFNCLPTATSSAFATRSITTSTTSFISRHGSTSASAWQRC